MSNTNRTRGTGRYTYEMDRPCVCGHLEHTAERALYEGKPYQPCIARDFDETIVCDCECYRPVRKSRK